MADLQITVAVTPGAAAWKDGQGRHRMIRFTSRAENEAELLREALFFIGKTLDKDGQAETASS